MPAKEYFSKVKISDKAETL